MATVFKRYGARNSLSTNYGVSIDVKTEYTDKTQKFYQLFKANLNSSLEAMGNAMKNRALITVPRKSGGARQHAALHLAALHQLAQHLDQHHLKQAVEYGGPPAALGKRFLKQQLQHHGGIGHLLQRQADHRGQGVCNRVMDAAGKHQIGAHHVGAGMHVALKAVRHGPWVQQQARLGNVLAFAAVVDRQRAAPDQVQLPHVLLGREPVAAAQRARMEHFRGDREVIEQSSQTIHHRNTPSQ